MKPCGGSLPLSAAIPCSRMFSVWRSCSKAAMSAHRKSYADPVTAAEACGAHILALLETALSGEAGATLAVSGGTTPKLMFDYMARAHFDWSHVHIFWVDERMVPPNHEQSNYRMIDEHLLKPARIP